jgi:hypothetical protein
MSLEHSQQVEHYSTHVRRRHFQDGREKNQADERGRELAAMNRRDEHVAQHAGEAKRIRTALRAASLSHVISHTLCHEAKA